MTPNSKLASSAKDHQPPPNMPPKTWKSRRGDEVYRLCRKTAVPTHIQRRLQELIDDVVGEKANLDRVLHERNKQILSLKEKLDAPDPPLEELYRAGSKLITRQAEEIREVRMGREKDLEVVAGLRGEVERLKSSVGSSAQAEQIRKLQIALEEARIANPNGHFTPGIEMAEEQANAALNLVRNLQRDVAERDRTTRAHTAEMASSAAASGQMKKELEAKVKHWQAVAEDAQQLIQQLNAENRELVRQLNPQ